MIIKRLTLKLGRKPKRVAYFLVAKAGLREIEFVNDNVVQFSPNSILDEETLNFNETSGELN